MKLGQSRTRTGAGMCFTTEVLVSRRPSPSSLMSPELWNDTSGPSTSTWSMTKRRSFGSTRNAIPALVILIGFSPGRSVPNVPEACVLIVQGSVRACGRSTTPVSTNIESPARNSVRSTWMLRA